jgi:hypothetical protein
MTIDKETLIKHRFWIALGAFTLLWLVGLIVIPIAQGSDNEKKVKEFDTRKKEVSSINDPKNDNYKQPLESKEKVLNGKKNDVWGKAYEPQGTMMTWPEGGAPHLEKLNDQPFGAYISSDDRSEYRSELYDRYLTGLKLPEIVKPVEFSGDWTRIIRPVSKWSVDRLPTVEECWLAQEDLWVKRELLLIIQRTLDSIRIFKDFEPAEKDAKLAALPEGGKRQLLRNANWELDLITEPDPDPKSKEKKTVISAKSTIKNINPWKRNLSLADVKFRVKQGKSDNFMDFAVPVDRLNWDETTDIKKAFSFGQLVIDPSQNLEVEQVLTWSTSPIKRINALELGYNSHRTANRTCKAKPIGNQKPSEDAAKDSAGPLGPGGPMPGGSGLMSGTGNPMMVGVGKGGAGDNDLNADLKRERYLDFTDQVRWMPVAMVLIVDQGYMQDVQTAVVNSRLRIQPTQIAFHRAYGIRPATTSDRNDKGDRPRTGDSGDRPSPGPASGGMSKGAGMRQMFAGSGGYGTSSPPGIPGGAGAPPPTLPGGGAWPGIGASTSATVEEDPNLVELSIYGIASLYERPAKPAAPATK